MKYRVIKNTENNCGSYDTEKFNEVLGIWESYDGTFENGEDKDAIKFCEEDSGHSASWEDYYTSEAEAWEV